MKRKKKINERRIINIAQREAGDLGVTLHRKMKRRRGTRGPSETVTGNV